MASRRAVIIGVTGRLGCGKSTLCDNAVALKGYLHFDADKIGHETYQVGTPVYEKLIKHFGTEILAKDGSIDRALVGRCVFGNPQQLIALQKLVWPAALELLSAKLKSALAIDETGTTSIVLVEGALLAGASEWLKMFSGIIVLDCPDDMAVSRALHRPSNQLTEHAIRQRLSVQQSAKQMRAAIELVGLPVTAIDTGDADVAENTETFLRAISEMASKSIAHKEYAEEAL